MSFKESQKRIIKNILFFPRVFLKPKVFCLSMQRSGTTSVGEFLKDHGYRVAGWGDSKYNKWDYFWHIGDYGSIFRSFAFKSFQAYQDSPWWAPDFYKILFHKFPKAKFILLSRNSDQWFNSMIKHSKGKTLGNTKRHCKIYRRMSEFYSFVEKDSSFNSKFDNTVDNLMLLDGMREHYINIYEEHYKEVIDFFNQFKPEALFIGELEDPDIWQRIGRFLKIDVNSNYKAHANKSDK